MAQYVRHHGPAPEVLIASPAVRAFETARLFAAAYHYPSNQILTDATIYDEADAAEAQTLLRIIHRLDNLYQTAMIFGHDPLFTAFARFLCQDFTASLPPGAVVCCAFQVVSWLDIAPGRGQVRFFHRPQDEREVKPEVAQTLPVAGSFELPQAAQQRFIHRLTEHYTVKQEQAATVHTTYYDTFDWRLFNKALTLVKTDGTLVLWSLPDDTALHSIQVTSPPVFIADFPPSDLQKQVAPIIKERALLGLFAITSQGRILRILDDNKKTVLQLELREHTVSSQDTTLPLATRLSLRPIRGYDKQAHKMARWLLQQGCTPMQNHLYDRALAVLHKTPNDYTTKLNFQLHPMMRADAASKLILQFLCQVIRRNEQGIIADIDTEFLHDFRVAVRRTRAALAQIKRVFPAHITARGKRDFAWLGRLTNAQRDLDVHLLCQERYQALLSASRHADIDPFFAYLRQERAKAHGRLVRTLTTKKYADLLRRWEAFLACPVQDTASAPNAHRPIGAVAQKRVWKLWQRVVEVGEQRIDLADDEGLHALRIECKKLRYVLEFFASLFPPETIAAALKQLRRVQDTLGHYHDLCVQQAALRHFADRFATGKSPEHKTLQAIASLISSLEQEKQALHHTFAGIFRAFASSTPPRGK
jgi:CHAD domain-containing protein/phosphohistidine phosphatase SixA